MAKNKTFCAYCGKISYNAILKNGVFICHHCGQLTKHKKGV